MEPRLTVVVPVHNVERYLDDCLASIAGQSFGALDVVMVDDGSTDAGPRIAAGWARRDRRFRLVRQDNAGLGHARNTGVRHADDRTRYLAFADSDDVVAPRAYERLVGLLEESGSDFATGNVYRLDARGRGQAWQQRGMTRTVTRTHITRDLGLLADRVAWNKVFRRAFWDRHALTFPEGVLYEDTPLTIPAHFLAEAVDVLADHVYYWRLREGSITRRRTDVTGVRDRIAGVDRVSRFLAGSFPAHKRDYDRSVLTDDLLYFMAALPVAGPEYRRAFMAGARDWLARVDRSLLTALPVELRIRWRLVDEGRLADLLVVLGHELAGGRGVFDLAGPPLRRRRAVLPRPDGSPVPMPRSTVAVRAPDLPVVARLREAAWRDGRLVLRGHAYIRNVDARSRHSVLRAALATCGRRTLLLPLRAIASPEVTDASGQERHCYDWAGFEIVLDPRRLRRAGALRPGQWRIAIVLAAGTRVRPAALRPDESSSGASPAPYRVTDGLRLVPWFSDGRLQVAVEPVRARLTGHRTGPAPARPGNGPGAGRNLGMGCDQDPGIGPGASKNPGTGCDQDPGIGPGTDAHPSPGSIPNTGTHPSPSEDPSSGRHPGQSGDQGAGAQSDSGSGPNAGAHPTAGSEPGAGTNPSSGHGPEGRNPCQGGNRGTGPHGEAGSGPGTGTHPDSGIGPVADRSPGMGGDRSPGSTSSTGAHPSAASTSGTGPHPDSGSTPSTGPHPSSRNPPGIPDRTVRVELALRERRPPVALRLRGPVPGGALDVPITVESAGAGRSGWARAVAVVRPDRLTAARPTADGLPREVVPPTGVIWPAEVLFADGSTARVAVDGPPAPCRCPLPAAADGTPRELSVEAGPAGTLVLRDDLPQVFADTLTRTSGGRFRVEGALPAAGAKDDKGGKGDALLVLRHDTYAAEVTVAVAVTGERFAAEPDAAALPHAGQWRLLLRADGRDTPVRLAAAGPEPVPLDLSARGRALRLDRRDHDHLAVTASGTVPAADRGPYRQRLLRERRYPVLVRRPLRPAVLYSSFDGHDCADSPRAVHEELVRRGAPVEHLWVVRDGRTAVPVAGRAVVHGSHAWYEALARSRYVLTNTHLPPWFERRPGQRVVQTWHGTPVKRIGLDLAGTLCAALDHGWPPPRVGEQWSLLLSPSAAATPVLRRALDFRGEIAETGLPRTDRLCAEDRGKVADEVRARLGLPAGRTVVLYAPTVRDDESYGAGRHRLHLPLHLAALERELAASHVLLVRAHPLVTDTVPADGRFVRDVSGHPDLAELLLAADVLVTDYSAVLADFAVTGRPVLLHAPDLAYFRDTLRGFAVDYERVAPGPLLGTTAALIEALRDPAAAVRPYEAAYAAFRATFCHLDDGRAAARVADLMLC